VQVTGVALERPVVPAGTIALSAIALRAGTDREVRVNAASVIGSGERWHAAWRWWDNRPRVAVGLDAPAPFGGVWSLGFVRERETYGDGPGFQQQRRTVSFSYADWLTGTTRWEAGLTSEEWPDGRASGVTGGVRYQTLNDRFAAAGRTTLWSHNGTEWLTGVSFDWRSRTRNEGSVIAGRAAASVASGGTPLFAWNGAGSGQGRDELLRAHPLLDDGVIRDAVFGRGLVNGTVEWRRWSAPFKRVLRLAPAVFVDAARAHDVPEFADRRGHVDAGGGVRLAIPGAGILRADVAVGLRDGRTAFSVGWTR
jgi:hypothetical protein